jgi:uncharacterized protein YbjT (DUF2867 family)
MDERRILVIGATGRVGHLLVEELLHAGARVRALTRRPDQSDIPPGAEVAMGDLTAPASLDTPLDGVDSVFLVWTAPVATASGVITRLAMQPSGAPRRIVYLSAPFRTPHPFFQQPNPLRELHTEVERVLSATKAPTVILRPGMFASNVVHWWARATWCAGRSAPPRRPRSTSVTSPRLPHGRCSMIVMRAVTSS